MNTIGDHRNPKIPDVVDDLSDESGSLMFPVSFSVDTSCILSELESIEIDIRKPECDTGRDISVHDIKIIGKNIDKKQNKNLW